MQYRLGGLAPIAIVGGALFLASCTVTAPSPATAPAAESAKPYGSLTIGTDLAAGQVDPQLGSPNSLSYTSVSMFDSLVYYDAAGKVKPGIGERWEISPDGKTHTWYIRKGVKFHDGSDLTGADVKFSIERQMAPESANTEAPVWRTLVSSVELKDDYTLVLRLKSPQFDLMRGYDFGMTTVVPKNYIEKNGADYFRSHFVGSGPWKLVRYVTGDRLELEALDSHWRTAPKFKNLTLLHVKEEATKASMLKTGELDLAQVTPESAPSLKAAGLRIFSQYSGAQYFGVPFYDMDHPEKYALGDVRVRKALQLAINSKEIADKLLGGYGEPYAFLGADSAAYFWDSNVLKPNPYDPEQAKKLLAEASYTNGFNTRIHDTGGGGLMSTINLAVSGYWQKVGVSAQVIPIAQTSITPQFRPKQVPEIWNSVFVSVGSLPRNFEKMPSVYHSTQSAFKNIRNPRLDELIEKVPTLSDPAEKKRLALEAAVLASNEHSTLKIVAAHTVMAVGPKIGDVVLLTSPGIPALMFETIPHAK